MRSLRLGRWLLLPWLEDEKLGKGRRVEFDAPHDAARLLSGAVALDGATSLRAFVHELELGAPVRLNDRELIERLAALLVRGRVRLFDIQEPPMASDELQVLDYAPEPTHHENVIEELEFIDWSVELGADEPLWFEVSSAPDELPDLSVELEQDELPSFSTELSTSQHQ